MGRGRPTAWTKWKQGLVWIVRLFTSAVKQLNKMDRQQALRIGRFFAYEFLYVNRFAD